ncbi:MAG: hypothetical protein N2441_01670 [Rhodocyclaceae bacterium]|nr:hypothetical protein [Rhodocyclaceae bacterium]
MHLVLFLPGFLLPGEVFSDTAHGLETPSLTLLLARSRQRRWQGPTMNRLFALRHWPAAILRRHALALETRGQWLCLDPIPLEVRREGVFLIDPEALALTPEEDVSLRQAIAPLFATWGRLESSQPGRWELQLRRPLVLTACPLPMLIGQAVRPEHLQGEDAQAFRRRLVEAETLLHAHPVSRRREEKSLPRIASLWPWGGGALEQGEALLSPFAGVFARDVETAGLCRLVGIPYSAPPAEFVLLKGRWLVVLDELAKCARNRDALGWRHALVRLEKNWFVPLLVALRRGALRSLELILTDAQDEAGLTLRITPASLWRFWRKPRALSLLMT